VIAKNPKFIEFCSAAPDFTNSEDAFWDGTGDQRDGLPLEGDVQQILARLSIALTMDPATEIRLIRLQAIKNEQCGFNEGQICFGDPLVYRFYSRPNAAVA
jgi:hypothetical protein